MHKRVLVLLVAMTSLWIVLVPTVRAQENLPSKADASCIKCHADYEKKPSLFAGKFVDSSWKSKTIQLQINKDMEVIHYDDDTILKNAPSIKEIPKQESVRVVYAKKNGKNIATLIEVKKGIDFTKEQLATVEEVAALVAKGPEKGKYVLYDSRPENMYNEGHIPSALPLPFFAFDKMADKLPQDKSILQIYYCAGFS
jgi:hypothetical protein